jgi:hypothetical protein
VVVGGSPARRPENRSVLQDSSFLALGERLSAVVQPDGQISRVFTDAAATEDTGAAYQTGNIVATPRVAGTTETFVAAKTAIPLSTKVVLVLLAFALVPLGCIAAAGLRAIISGQGSLEGDHLECECGNMFLKDAHFCRRCGKPRADVLASKGAEGVEPSMSLNGRWARHGKEVCIINCDEMIWSSGKKEPTFKRTSDTVVQFTINQRAFEGKLQDDGNLHWCDDEVWAKCAISL